jgi:hypothetical protein
MPTFRRNTNTQDYITTIDGAVLSAPLAHNAHAEVLATNARTQHRQVGIAIALTPDFHKTFRWFRPCPDSLGPWANDTLTAFNAALANNIDEA